LKFSGDEFEKGTQDDQVVVSGFFSQRWVCHWIIGQWMSSNWFWVEWISMSASRTSHLSCKVTGFRCSVHTPY